MSKRSKVFLIVASVAAIAFLAMAVFVFTSFRVVKLPTGSMANTIVPGESVLCFLSGSEVKRGEIILFKLPTDPKVTYLKRVIGLPGDRIQIRGVKVFINGAELPEERTFIELTPSQPIQPELSSEGAGSYRVYYEKRPTGAEESWSEHPGMKFGVAEEFQIPAEKYFVLGDCRDNSLDSRYWGTVPRENILGRALMIIVSNDPQRQSKLFQTLK
ncbi:MAG TPA: signal peptidase I [Blastocatellia bacterium]|nr:signal peptidase I [Blastocatellia bacterium]HMV87870.1 signal peptidase I [Blastocatellia bacterium]HMY76276.1 signal peptidase I [Blastocatellia bacterium]HMZ22199.1 signal peptidase I [Blastocatellia bacterium]HNG34709.1 signal peptidase I [Blastocatellia bacterium]